MVRETQARERVPAVSAALHRADRPLWTFQVGTSGRPDAPLDERTRFRIGSVTKTFTAVLIMQCRDEGLLDLDDPISAHLKVPSHGELTIRRLLSHTSGLQREPYGDVWDTLQAPSAEQLLEDLVRAERVLPPGRRWHYSNLGYSLLGLAVGRLRGGTWAEVLSERILAPLGLRDISPEGGGRAAVGYLVDAYSDHVREEPPADFEGLAAAGQLWGTAADLARWGAFLADPESMDPDAAVLSPATLDEMRWPVTTIEDAVWGGGWGLGLILLPRDGRVVHVGHDGAMPGFLAGAYGRRGPAMPTKPGSPGTPRAMGAAVLGSSGTADATIALAHDLLATSVEHDPADIEPWTPGEPAPDTYRSALGRWWGEGFEFVFHWRDGSLRASATDAPPGKPPAVFAPVDGQPDVLRGISGRETGELLRLTRDPDTGAIVRMHWATYRFTRTQETFDGVSASEP